MAEGDGRGGGVKFTANQSNSTIKLQASSSAPSVDLVYSTDGSTWNAYTVGDTITLTNVGDYVFFKAGSNGNTRFSSASNNYHRFVMAGSIAASGSIMYLLDEDGDPNATMDSYCFAKLFNGCTSLTSAPKLPSMNLAADCYNGMFQGCTSLTASPALPALTTYSGSYSTMFDGCSALTSAGEVSATTFAQYSCQYMFQNCTSLTTPPILNVVGDLGNNACR